MWVIESRRRPGRELAAVACRNSLQVGMIWGGGSSDAQWMDQARLHIRETEAAGLQLDRAIFVSSDLCPARTFPATDPDALTSPIPTISSPAIDAGEGWPQLPKSG